MKNVLLALVLVCTSAFAFASKENPHEEFSMSKNFSNEIALTIIPSDNVQATCDSISRKRGHGGFKYAVEACSFWDSSRFGNKCTIVLPKNTNYHTIGHEMRHCLHGDYHK